MVSILDGVFGKPSPAKFAQLMARALREVGVEDAIDYDEKHERKGLDVFVASYQAYEKPEKKELRSVCA